MSKRGEFSRRELLFSFGIILYYFTFFADITVLTDTWDLNSPVFKAIRLVSYALFLLAILDEEVSKKTLIIFLVVFPVMGICAICGEDNSVIYMALILLAGLTTSSKRLITLIVWLQIICLVVVMGLCAAGIFEDVIYTSGERSRHCMGFFWTTTPALLAMFIGAVYIYQKAEKISLIELAVIEAVQIFFYIFTDSRMCFAVATLMVVLTFILRYGKTWVNKLFSGCCKAAVALPILLCGISIGAQAAYNENSPVWVAVNQFLHNRLSLGHEALKQFDITLFGQLIKWVGNTQQSETLAYNYVDNSYLQLLLSKGILFLGLVILVYTAILIRAAKRGEVYTSLVVTMVLILSVTEPRLWDWTFNPFPFLITDVLREKMVKDTRRIRLRGTAHGIE
jgi:hypothetical protein